MKIILTGNPQSTNTLYRRHGHVIYMTHEGRALKADYSRQAKAQWQRVPILTDMAITVGLFFKDKRRRDIDNWHKILLDSLTGIVWKDDSQIVDMRVTKVSGDENPRIEVEIISTA